MGEKIKIKGIVGALTLLFIGILFGAILVSGFGLVRPGFADINLGASEPPGKLDADASSFSQAFIELAEKVTPAIVQISARFGRGYGAIERYGKEGAEVLLMTSGTVTSTSRIVVQTLAENGVSVAGIKIKRFRPFPSEEIYEAIRGANKLAVIDRNLSAGVGGIFAQELRASLYSREERLRSLDSFPDWVEGILPLN